jgi:hypothetical protein
VKFIDAAEIAQQLGIPWEPNRPDGDWQRSPQFVRKRNEMLHTWLTTHGVGDSLLISGYFKEIETPKLAKGGGGGILSSFYGSQDNPKCKERLQFMGGYYDYNEASKDPERNGVVIQPPSDGKHTADYFDYSHSVRFIESDKIEVQKKGGEPKTMTIGEFNDTTEFALEFCFDKAELPKRSYPYYPELALWMEQHGHIRAEYDSPKDKEERAKVKEKEEKKKEKEEKAGKGKKGKGTDKDGGAF